MKSQEAKRIWFKAMRFYKLEVGRGRFYMLIPRTRLELNAPKNTWSLGSFLIFMLVLDIGFTFFYGLNFNKITQNVSSGDFLEKIIYPLICLILGWITFRLLQAARVLWIMVKKGMLEHDMPPQIDIRDAGHTN